MSYYDAPRPWNEDADRYGPKKEPMLPEPWTPESDSSEAVPGPVEPWTQEQQELDDLRDDFNPVFEDEEAPAEPQETIDLHKFDDLTDEELFDVFFETDIDLSNNDEDDDGA